MTFHELLSTLVAQDQVIVHVASGGLVVTLVLGLTLYWFFGMSPREQPAKPQMLTVPTLPHWTADEDVSCSGALRFLHQELQKKVDDVHHARCITELKSIQNILEMCQSPKFRHLNKTIPFSHSMVQHNGLQLFMALAQSTTASNQVKELSTHLIETIVPMIW